MAMPDIEKSGLDHEDAATTGEGVKSDPSKPTKSAVLVVALAFLFSPAVILLHECGHFVAYYLQGVHVVVYSSEVGPPAGASTPNLSNVLGVAGGPMVEVLLCVSGFVWLRRRRRDRSDTKATGLDWLATSMCLCCARWIHHTPDVLWRHHITGHYRSDEVYIPMLMGLPGWILPVVLFIPACCILVATIRHHSRSHRLFLFGAWFLGGTIGALLWVLLIGPAVLGQQPHPFKLLPPTVPPRVISISPANGAADVDPELKEIRITFSRQMMAESWAYCGSGPHFPGVIAKPHYNGNRTVWSVQIQLRPEWDYECGLNTDPRYEGFISEDGVALAPVRVKFRRRRAENAH